MGSNAGEDAATTPHVDTGVVIAIAKQDVGRAVPQRHDLAGVSTDEDSKEYPTSSPECPTTAQDRNRLASVRHLC